MPKPRADNIEMERRIQAIQGWLLEFNPYGLIKQQILNNRWCSSERHADRLIKKARERWVKDEDEKRDEDLKLAVIKLQNAQRGMNNQYKGTPAGMTAVLAIQKEINKMKGYYFRPDLGDNIGKEITVIVDE